MTRKNYFIFSQKIVKIIKNQSAMLKQTIKNTAAESISFPALISGLKFSSIKSKAFSTFATTAD